MFGLLDDDAPPPRFSFSALVSLVTCVGVAYLEAQAFWRLAVTSPYFLLVEILSAVVIVAPATLLASIVSFIAIYFKQGRWAFVGFAIMGVPYVIFAIYLLIAALVTR